MADDALIWVVSLCLYRSAAKTIRYWGRNVNRVNRHIATLLCPAPLLIGGALSDAFV